MTQTDITTYIPQAAPFVMVEEIISADEAVSVTSFTIQPDNIFVRYGLFTEPGLVENMAQTAAAGTGYRASQEGQAPKVGFIGALKNLRIDSLPKVGQQIITEVSFMHQILNVHIVQGRVLLDGEEIASCELKIFLEQ